MDRSIGPVLLVALLIFGLAYWKAYRDWKKDPTRGGRKVDALDRKDISRDFEDRK